jgi:hypothetical protein
MDDIEELNIPVDSQGPDEQLENILDDQQGEKPEAGHFGVSLEDETLKTSSDAHSSQPQDEEVERRPTRTRKIKNYQDLVNGKETLEQEISLLQCMENSLATDSPKTYEEAMNSIFIERWRDAINDELNSINQHQIWTDEFDSVDSRPCTTKWIFTIKRDERGNPIRWKARLVVRGFEQQEGIDFNEIFAPVLKYNSLKAIVVTAAAEDLEIEQLDINTAFLYGELKEQIYIYAPEGSGYPPRQILKLQKALYGIKQAPRVFNEALTKHISEYGFEKCIKDPCVMIKKCDDGQIITVASYVDDILVTGKDREKISHVKNHLQQKFEIEDKGPANFILRIKITRNRAEKTIQLNQTRFVNDLMDRYGTNNAECTCLTPLPSDFQLSSE